VPTSAATSKINRKVWPLLGRSALGESLSRFGRGGPLLGDPASQPSRVVLGGDILASKQLQLPILHRYQAVSRNLSRSTSDATSRSRSHFKSAASSILTFLSMHNRCRTTNSSRVTNAGLYGSIVGTEVKGSGAAIPSGRPRPRLFPTWFLTRWTVARRPDRHRPVLALVCRSPSRPGEPSAASGRGRAVVTGLAEEVL
jgi:hypothetical protein